MTDHRSYGEAEWIVDVTDSVRELDDVSSHSSWGSHELTPRTIFRTTSRTKADSHKSGIAIAKTKGENSFQIVAAQLIVFQSGRIAVLVELKLELNGALCYTLLTGKRELASELTTRCEGLYRSILPGEKQHKE